MASCRNSCFRHAEGGTGRSCAEVHGFGRRTGHAARQRGFLFHNWKITFVQRLLLVGSIFGRMGKCSDFEAKVRSGKERLDEMVWIALFAGYGGTSNLAYETLKMIRKVRGLRYPVTCCEQMASHDPVPVLTGFQNGEALSIGSFGFYVGSCSNSTACWWHEPGAI